MMPRVILVLLFSVFKLYAKDVTVDVYPKNPQVNSPYTVTFRIKSNNSIDPKIKFDHKGAELLDNQSRGVSMRTKFVNGKLFTERAVVYTYRFVNAQKGTIWIRNILVTIGNQKISHPDIQVNVLAGIPQTKTFFVEAQVSKEEVFVNEGINVKYYMFSKGTVRNFELKSYPKLKKFLKRFINKPERSQNVEIKGEVFRRDLLYSARVFAEKPGVYEIDPIRLRVEHSKHRTNNPFNIGPSFRRSQFANIQSKRVEIVVKPLPSAPPDINFTGLVGQHSFKFTSPKSRYLVNEPIELKFEVIGEGALEIYNGPEVYTHPNLEEFENSSDFNILEIDSSSKIYEYTYLGRSALQIPERGLVLSYFNPEKIEYKKVEIIIPRISVLGGVIAPVNALIEKNIRIAGSKNEESLSNIIGPIFVEKIYNRFEILRFINITLILSIIFIILSFLKIKRNKNYRLERAEDIINSLKRGKSSYSEVFQLFNIIRGESKQSLEEFIKKQNLSLSTQDYLLKLIKEASNTSYLNGEKIFKFKYSKKPFQELLKLF